MTTSIAIKNHFSELARLSEETETALNAAGISMETIHAVNIALEEVVTNIIKYGYTDGADHEIETRIAAGNSELTISVIDEGREFNPLSLPPPDVAAPIEEREIGGLGVHFVRKLMDGVEYRRDGNKNIFIMRKKCATALDGH